MRFLCLFIVSITIFKHDLIAQSSGRNQVKQMLCVTGSANTNGWGVGISYGRKRSEKTNDWLNLSLSEIKHDKEEKLKPNTLEVQGYGKPIPYIYGKQNSFYTMNIGYSQQRLLLKGSSSPSVTISFVCGADFSFGLLKPYYLKIKHSNNNILTIEDEKYSLSNADSFLANNKIYSRSRFAYGLNETKLIPGIHLHLGTQVDIGSNVWIKAIRIGGSVSMYSKKIPMMIDAEKSQLFANFNLSINVGRGW